MPSRRFILALAAAVLAIPLFAAEKSFESTPQVKAYRVQMKAVAAGDFDGYKKTMTKESARKIDEQMKESKLDPKKGMEILKAMAPTDLKIAAVKIDGSKATVEATGTVMGEANKGTVEMQLEDGAWKVANQSWTNAK